MCGIVGLFSDDRGIDSTRIERCLEKIQHRGPDGSGHWVNTAGTAGLGHRRLAMVDVAEGQQPVFNEDKTIVAVVNGEFYGHREIRSQLQSAGHRFDSHSDSAILVHLYEQYGLDFFHHLRGEFAFLLWDQPANRLIAARDRFGIKPLVWFANGKNIGFASEAKALFGEIPSVAWDMESLAFATTLQYLPPTHTLFKGIQQVPPGCFATIRNGGVELEPYWDFNYPHRQTQNFAECDYPAMVEATRSLLVESVLDRIPDEVPCCFHLSGGVDSSAVLGIASQETGQQQKAFSICCTGEGYDEKQFALAAAKHCGADLDCLEFSSQQYIDAIHPSARASEGLAINGHLPAKYLLNREIQAQGFKAVLTGEGADEVFLGYAHLQIDWQSAGSNQLGSTDRLGDPSSLGMMLPVGESLSTSTLKQRLGFVPTFLAAKATLGCRVHSLLADEVLGHWSRHDPFAQFLEFSDSGQLTGRHPVHQAAVLWSKWALAGYILKTLGDGTEMPFSVEGRVPFLDHRLIERTRHLPLEWFYRDGAAKQLLRDAVQPYVTDEIFRRVKHPFDAEPVLLNNSVAIREFLYDQLNSEAFRDQPVFCGDKVRALLDKTESMDRLERQAWDPAITLLSTLVGIQEFMN